MKTSITILGDGGWGTALALHAHGRGHSVTVWGYDPGHLAEVVRHRENRRFLPGVRLPSSIRWRGDPGAALENARLVVMAIPTQFARGALHRFRGLIPRAVPIVSVAKGIGKKTLALPTDIIHEVLGTRRTAVLSGPSHAEEVARGLPATVVAASRSAAVARRVQGAFHGGALRVYTSRDVVGV